MDNEYVQNLRYKLQKRVRRVNSAGHESILAVLNHLMVFVNGNAVLSDIVTDLDKRFPSAKDDSDSICSGTALFGSSESEQAALGWHMMRRCLDDSDGHKLLQVCFAYNVSEVAEQLDFFRDSFVEPLYDYLDEHLDDQRALLAILRRYKHKCEWFRRDALFNLWQSDTPRGERLLAIDLYEHLHDQGIEFTIEPTSASGKPDLISAQVGEERLIADAKIYGDTTPKAYLAKGFHQIYQYTLDYNQPFGYLVIFKTCATDLKFPMEEQEQSIPFLTHNNKTIFFVVIDICQHEQTASKRGPLKTIVVTPDDLIHMVDSSR